MMIATTFRRLSLSAGCRSSAGRIRQRGGCGVRAVPRRHQRRCDDGPGARSSPGELDACSCKHLTAGDGFISMADGQEPLHLRLRRRHRTSRRPTIVLDSLSANFSAPTIELKQGDNFYLTLTNVAMAMRPDLFDPHTVHFHGFPQQPPVFDGMPEGSFGVNMGSSVTYYYKLNDPGTYMYHCHRRPPSTCRWACSATCTSRRRRTELRSTLRRQDVHQVRLQRRRRLHRLRRRQGRCSSARWTTCSTNCTWACSRCPSRT